MDWHEVALGAITLLVAAIGFMSSRMAQKIDDLEDSFDDLRAGVYERFVMKDEYHRDISYIKHVLDKIFDKLDDKVDKA